MQQCYCALRRSDIRAIARVKDNYLFDVGDPLLRTSNYPYYFLKLIISTLISAGVTPEIREA